MSQRRYCASDSCWELEVSCPTFPQSRWSSSEGMHRAQQAGRPPGEVSASGQPVDSLFPACCWPSSLSELLPWCYWTYGCRSFEQPDLNSRSWRSRVFCLFCFVFEIQRLISILWRCEQIAWGLSSSVLLMRWVFRKDSLQWPTEGSPDLGWG